MIYLYTLDNCEKCDDMRTCLNNMGIVYSEVKFKNLDALFDKFKDHLYIIGAPVLVVNDVYYDEPCLFDGDLVRSDIITLFENYMDG
jgi:glutaredoxin